MDNNLTQFDFDEVGKKMLALNKKYLSIFWQNTDTYLLCKLKPLKLSRQWIFKICQTPVKQNKWVFLVLSWDLAALGPQRSSGDQFSHTFFNAVYFQSHTLQHQLCRIRKWSTGNKISEAAAGAGV